MSSTSSTCLTRDGDYPREDYHSRECDHQRSDNRPRDIDCPRNGDHSLNGDNPWHDILQFWRSLRWWPSMVTILVTVTFPGMVTAHGDRSKIMPICGLTCKISSRAEIPTVDSSVATLFFTCLTVGVSLNYLILLIHSTPWLCNLIHYPNPGVKKIY